MGVDERSGKNFDHLCLFRKNMMEVDGQRIKVPAEPTEFELNAIRNDPVRRSRLCGN